MSLLDFLNPFLLYDKYVRTPVLAFVTKQYLDYKRRTDKGLSNLKELLCRAGILLVFVSAIAWISVFMYVVFYYTYMPNVAHVRPVHLQFKSCDENMGVCSFPSAHVQLTKKSHMLMAAQPYRIRLVLDMPESQVNKDLGMFMVCAQMRAKGGVLVSSSCRSAMLRHRLFENTPVNIKITLTAGWLIENLQSGKETDSCQMPLEPINDDQMEILLDFADRCRHLCFGRQSSRSDAQSIAYREWKELSRDMNYAGPDDCWKSGLEWKWYWTALKNRAKAKMAHAKRRSRLEGDQVRVNLTPYERRIIELAELAAAEPKKTGSDESTTDATDDSRIEENCNQMPESMVIKVTPTPHLRDTPTDHSMTPSQRQSYREPYNCQIHNSLVQPEMISIIQAEINGMSQTQNPNSLCEPINMSQYSNESRTEHGNNLHDISQSVLNTSQSYTEINPHNMSQNLSVQNSFVGQINNENNQNFDAPMNDAQRSFVAQNNDFAQRNGNGQMLPNGRNIQKKDVSTQCSVPMDINMHDFATSPINVGHTNERPNPNIQIGGVSEQRLECIRVLAQAISNLAEGTHAIARAQRMLATSQKAMANSQEMMACSIENSGTWQTALAASNEAVAAALRGLRESMSRLHQLFRTLVLAPLLLSGYNEEKQQLQVELFSDFEDDQDLPVTDAYVELQSRFIQVYWCELQIEAHFHGLRYVMFHWPKISACIGISTNLFFVSLIFILSWYHLQDGLPDFVKFQQKLEHAEIKKEEDEDLKKLVNKIKLEREDSSTFFDESSFLEDLPLEELKKT